MVSAIFLRPYFLSIVPVSDPPLGVQLAMSLRKWSMDPCYSLLTLQLQIQLLCTLIAQGGGQAQINVEKGYSHASG